MPSKLKHILIERPGDRKIISENIAQYRLKTNTELIERYNKQQALGLVGSWPQALMCFSLCIIFKERFGKSPVLVENFVLYNLRYNLYLRNLLIKKYFEKIRFLHFS